MPKRCGACTFWDGDETCYTADCVLDQRTRPPFDMAACPRFMEREAAQQQSACRPNDVPPLYRQYMPVGKQ